jgi:3-deoxy-D-manno-octulosonic-acid transferase
LSWPVTLGVYRGLTAAAGPILPLILSARVRAGKEDPRRVGERLAQELPPRAPNPLVWLHGASVGETMMLARLVDVLAAARPDVRCVVTAQTLAAANVLQRRLPPSARHQMAPLDTPSIAYRFLEHWKPSLAVFAEGEIWPNLLVEAHRRKIPLALINARMTRRSLEGWLRFAASSRALFERFAYIGAADQLTAAGLETILGGPVDQPGSLKLDAPAPAVDRPEVDKLANQIGDRPIWLAASTHPGEEALALAAHATLRLTEPEALLILVPRHPARADEIAKLAPQGAPFARRTKGEPIAAWTQVYLADTLGELGAFFALSAVSVMGGGFVPGIGGHNPIEPARLGSYVLSGPHVENFREAYAAIEAHNAGQILREEGPRMLADSVRAVWNSRRDREALAASAAAWLPAPDAALTATLAQLLPLLPVSPKSLADARP